jgi:hypothetical protein
VTIDWYEYTSGGGLQFLRWYEVQPDLTIGTVEVVFRDNGQIDTPDAPVINVTTSVLNSATSVTVNWAEPPSGPEVTGYEFWMDDVHRADTLPTVLTKTYTSVPNDGLVHKFQVAAQGAGGFRGAFSGALLLQWTGTPVQPPPAPTSLTRSNLQPTSVQLSWTQPAVPVGDPAVASFNVRYGSGTLLRGGIPAAQTTTTVTGLTEQTTYTGVFVESVNTTGQVSAPSNTLTFTTPQSTGSGFGVPVMGMNFRDQADEPRQFDDYKAWRVYNNSTSDTQTIISRGGPTVIVAVTDPGTDCQSNSPAVCASGVLAYLTWLYEGTGSSTRQNVEAHICLGNEIDAGNYTQNVLDAHAQVRTVIWQLSGGVRRFPKASLWCDMTQNNIRTNGSGVTFKPIAKHLDGFACSMYNPGRSVNNNGPTWNAYSTYCDAVFTCLADWRASGGVGGASLVGQLDSFATWECGNPIDQATSAGDATASTNFSIRPRYFAGGRDSAGTTWVGFLNYVYNKCTAAGVSMREQCYWNHQSASDKPNPLVHDATGVPSGSRVNSGIDLETAWHNWTPGSTLPQG